MSLVMEGDGSGLRRRVRDIAERVAHPEALWPRVGRIVSREMTLQFESEGEYFGEPWRPLTPKYASWKIAHGYPRDILVQTGQMREGFTRNPMNIEEYFGNEATFGSRNQKAIWHHHGTKRHGRQVNPPRPILYLNRELQDAIVNEVKHYVMGEAEGL